MIDKTSNQSCLDLGFNIFWWGSRPCGKIQLILGIPKLEIKCTTSAKNKQLESATKIPKPSK